MKLSLVYYGYIKLLFIEKTVVMPSSMDLFNDTLLREKDKKERAEKKSPHPLDHKAFAQPLVATTPARVL